MTTRVLLVRHGQSEGNVGRIWTSAREGFPLTELGHEQARAVGETLVGRDVVAVYGSPLLRAQQTAAEIAGVLGLEPRTLEGVEEMHVGVHEGGHDDHVGPVAIEVFGRWWRDGDLSGGFDGGETGEQITSRFSGALDEVVGAHPDGTAVVVSHGGAMALSVAHLAGLDPLWVSQNFLKNTAVVELERSGNAWTCTSWAGEAPQLLG
jgi:probable phosphoglycerate mutase